MTSLVAHIILTEDEHGISYDTVVDGVSFDGGPFSTITGATSVAVNAILEHRAMARAAARAAESERVEAIGSVP